MKINIGIPEKNCNEIGSLLNMLLCDEYVLYTKTLNYHWNVTGVGFHDLHALFKEQYELLFTIVDEVAERARTLGVISFGSLAEFKQHTRLKEEPGKVPQALDMIRNLLVDHETIIHQLRHDIEQCTQLGDVGTNNFLTDLLEQHEKIAWMLRATAT